MIKKTKKILGFILIFVLAFGGMSRLEMKQGFAAIKADVVQIDAGEDHTLMLREDGTVWAWGSNSYGQLGNMGMTSTTPPAEVMIGGVKAIAAGDRHNLALSEDGTVRAWGANYSGQLGNGTTTKKLYPVEVNGLTNVKKIYATYDGSFAIKEDGTVWAWGANYDGQLGDGTTIDRKTPVKVNGITGVKEIAWSVSSTLALKEDGTLWAWGEGTTRTNGVIEPVQVKELTEVKGVAGLSDGIYAIKEDGTVWAWKWDDNGEFPDHKPIDTSEPVQIPELTNIKQITGMAYHCFALKEDGTVWAWGANDYGQLGDGTTTYQPTPIEVTELSEVRFITGGHGHSLALKEDGSVWAWGSNGCRQIGDEAAIIQMTPVLLIEPSTLSPVTGLKCTSTTQTSMALQWNMLKSATEYEVLINGAVSRITTGTSIVIDGLEPGTTYQVEVRGKSETFIGRLSQPIQVTVVIRFISTPAGLKEITRDPSGHYILANDINLEFQAWTPIGSSSSNAFKGTLDGAGYTIKNLSLSNSGGGSSPGSILNYVGLFGYTDGATIKNITLEEVSIQADQYTGALIGYMNSGTVENCVVQQGSVKGTDYVGGLIGGNGGGTVKNCGSLLNITSSTGENIGGLIGYNSGSVMDSYATGSVLAHGSSLTQGGVGGLVGVSTNNVYRSYATGDVLGDYCVGGLVGKITGGSVSDCFALGNIKGLSNCGGLVGYNQSASVRIERCYSTGSVIGDSSSSGGLFGNNATIVSCYYDINTSKYPPAKPYDYGKTSAEMKRKATFAGWDFSSIWQMDEGKSYPYLQSLPQPGNFPQSLAMGSTDISIVSGKEVMLAMAAEQILNTANKTFKITYNPLKLTLLDCAAQTIKTDTGAGKIPDTNLEIVSIANGVITLKLNMEIPPDKSFTGMLTILKFKANSTDTATITCEEQ